MLSECISSSELVWVTQTNMVLQRLVCRAMLWILWGRAILTSPVAAARSLNLQVPAWQHRMCQVWLRC